jgi:Tfp pilus assembly protein PilV
MLLESRTSRAGFTLAECLLAITLFTAGLLGLAGTALSVERLASASHARATAAELASARLESLRGTACALRASGSASTVGIAEQWSLTSVPDLTLIRDSLAIPAGVGAPAPPVVVEGAIPC